MAIGTDAMILDALLSDLNTISLSPQRAIAWPGIAFTPVSGTPYLAVSDFPTDTITRTVSTEGTVIYEGFLQVSAFWPKGQGLIAVKGLAGDIATHFKRGRSIRKNGTGPIVRIQRVPVIAAPIIEPAWVHVPVTVYWRSFNKHPA